MTDGGQGALREAKASRRRTRAAAALAGAALLGVGFFAAGAAAINIPPAVVKKTVLPKQRYQDAARVFAARCGGCHAAPDPREPTRAKTACTHGIPKKDLAVVQRYLVDVRAGRSLYESRCGRCHDLIEPGAHTADYWSKNLCSSEECFVKPLTGDEEQQLLLYLSSQAGENGGNRRSPQ